jgi:hypothetical protein
MARARTVTALATAEFEADAAVVYDILADYNEGHPAILPGRYFTHLVVERGGRGAGTVIRFGMRIGGRVREAVSSVEEPEPGRVLVERVADERGTVTTFTVDRLPQGGVRVTIHTRWRARGVAGLFESIVAPALLRRIYREELDNLARHARRTAPA